MFVCALAYMCACVRALPRSHPLSLLPPTLLPPPSSLHSCHRGRPNRRRPEGDDGQVFTRRLRRAPDALQTIFNFTKKKRREKNITNLTHLSAVHVPGLRKRWKEKNRKKDTRRHDAKDEGDRGRNGREGRKDGELKEAEEDGGGDRGTLEVGRGKDRGVSWD